ncbi:LysR family transcriptional regulator [Brotaphodocola sp.]|uniref:LysR family transcriptional regulator n=1 Tax=Brotaphodocola sp. TaxID=3073577 RepID=UPI003D7EA852
MTIRHMRIFLAVTENGNNLTRAASQLYMAQPAVTVAIQELEQYYGMNLFDRLGKRLYLTEAGKQFREYVVRILGLFDDMEEGMKSWGSRGVLRVGSSITIGSQFMPGYVEEYAKTHPNVDTQVLIGPSDRIEKKILNNELDIALVESPVHEKNLVAEQYMEDYLVIIAPGNSQENPAGCDLQKFSCGSQSGCLKNMEPTEKPETDVSKKETSKERGEMKLLEMSIEEFASQRLLLREPGSGTRESIEKVLEPFSIQLKTSWEATSTTALVNAVISGLGISIVPRRMVEAPLRSRQIREIHVKELKFQRYFYIVYHRDKLLTAPIRDFMEVCRNYESLHPQPRYSGLF